MNTANSQAGREKSFLLHPIGDLFLLGGASLLFSLIYFVFGLSRMPYIQYQLGFLILFSFPHFIASYAIFYGRAPDAPWRREKVTAIWLPLALAAVLLYSFSLETERMMVTIAQWTVALLYWHFLKQAYGVAVWLGIAPFGPAGNARKQLLLATLVLFGGYSFLGVQADTEILQTFHIPASTLSVPPEAVEWTRIASYSLCGVWAALFAFDLASKRLPVTAVWGTLPVAALITWLDPAYKGTAVKAIIPVFHAIQYFPFIYRVQLTEEKTLGLTGNGALKRRALVTFMIFAFGAISLYVLPKWLSGVVPHPYGWRIMALFTLFLNIHHYFIDAVIWRFRDPRTTIRLFGPKVSRPAETAAPGY